MNGADVCLVVPTIGAQPIGRVLAAIGGGVEHPAEIVVVDDRRDPSPELELPSLFCPVRVLRSGGRGPAAARNVGWLATETPWVAFVDDDVHPGPDWFAELLDDLAELPTTVGASSARLVVPLPGRRPTDEERRTIALTGARWITADMAYRREALLATGGFDERFPRAFREDSDLALRTVRAGFEIVRGNRVMIHPLRERGGWRGSITAQRGNADNALLRAKFGPSWRGQIGDGPGRTGRHLLAVGAVGTTLVALLARRRRLTAFASLVWVAETAEFAGRRIAPGPRTLPEITAMIITSAAIPPVALFWRAVGELRCRMSRTRAPKAVLFDRDGTLIHDVPYLADPTRVRPMDGATTALDRLRSAGVLIGIVSNQSGVARGLITPEELAEVNERVDQLLGPFDTWQVCPHRDEDDCGCRKPAAGLVCAAAHELGVQPRDCVLIGDIGADVQAALRAGAGAVLVPTPQTRAAEIAHARHAGRLAPDLDAAVQLVLTGSR